MKYIILLLFIFFPLFLNSATVKAKGFVSVKIINKEFLIVADDLLSNNYKGNEDIYCYKEGNYINFIF